jgi:hypothetical protein
VEYKLTGHLLDRMRSRGIAEQDIGAALADIVSTWPTPEDSTCIVGRTSSGRLLKIWVVGAHWPQSGTLTIKSSAWKDEQND